MDISVGDAAFAVRCGQGWALKNTCDPDYFEAGKDAVAVKAGEGWVLSPAQKPEDESDSFVIRSGTDKILWAQSCPEDNGGTEPQGPDPLCDGCTEDAGLQQTYTITISGIPAICFAEDFNGTWTVRWQSNCYWEVEIFDRCYIKMWLSNPWQIMFVDQNACGYSGRFTVGYDDDIERCHPEEKLWVPFDCYSAPGCPGLCSGFLQNASCIVTV